MLYVTYYFSIPDIKCINCIAPIETSLRECKQLNIKNLKVSLDKILKITVQEVNSSEETKKIIRDTLEEIGYECLDKKREKTFFEKYRHWFFASIGITSGIGILILTLIMPIPAFLLIPLTVLSIALTLFIGSEFYFHGFKNLFRSNTLTMDLLFSISTLTSIAVTISSFFVPWLSPLLDAGLLIFGFRHLGLAIEELIKDSMQVEKTFVERLPKKIEVLQNGNRVVKSIDELDINDIIYVKAGETIPVDSYVLNESEIYDTIISGSIWPRRVSNNDKVLSGMKVAQGVAELQLKVSAKLNDSYAATLDRQILNIEEQKSTSPTIAQKILKFFIPGVLLIACLSVTIVSFFFPISIAINCALTVLVSACPCTLGLIIPLAETIGWNKAKQQGIYFKDTAALQKANIPDWILFDFHGTITTGIITVSDFVIFDKKTTKDKLLSLFEVIEDNSIHPIAKAIKKYANEQNTGNKNSKTRTNVNSIQAANEPGLRYEINGATYTVGNSKMMQNYNIKVPDCEKELKPGDGLIYLAKDKVIIGAVIVTDPIRPNVKNLIKDIQATGVRVGGITGADQETANRIADEIGMDKSFLFAECRGGDSDENCKAKLIQGLPGRKVFVGDRENDEAAFKVADFSIAIQSLTGNEDTQSKADATIPRLDLLPSLFEIAKQTINNVKQNLIFSFCYNFLAVGIASGLLIGIGFTINPAIGVLLMIVQSTLILCNAIRFQHQRIENLSKIPKDDREQKELRETYQVIQGQLFLDNAFDSTLEDETKLVLNERMHEDSKDEFDYQENICVSSP